MEWRCIVKCQQSHEDSPSQHYQPHYFLICNKFSMLLWSAVIILSASLTMHLHLTCFVTGWFMQWDGTAYIHWSKNIVCGCYFYTCTLLILCIQWRNFIFNGHIEHSHSQSMSYEPPSFPPNHPSVRQRLMTWTNTCYKLMNTQVMIDCP
jgi:hypothetical protein